MPGLERDRTCVQLASATGGRYMRMQIDNSDLDYLLAENPLELSAQVLALDRTADTWDDQGYWFILLLLGPALALFRRGWIVCLAPLLLLPAPQQAQAGLWDDLWLTRDQQGQRAMQQEDNKSASQLFANRDWAGTAAYRDEDYETAAQHFGAGDSSDAWYNRGNALAKTGQLDEAIAAYRESLQRSPGREDAQQNLDLLEQLKQQQQQQGDESQDENQPDSEQQDSPQQNQQQGQEDQQQGQQNQPQDQQPESPRTVDSGTSKRSSNQTRNNRAPTSAMKPGNSSKTMSNSLTSSNRSPGMN